MPNAISSLPSPDLPIRHASDLDGAPDAAEFSFGEILDTVEENLSLADIIDVINPLQHIPIVSTLYRMITGDEISLSARLAGGALYGGAIGVAAAAAVAAFEEVSGETIEQQLASLVDDTSETGAVTASPTQQVAEAPTAEAIWNGEKPAQIAATTGIPALPGQKIAAQQVADIVVESIDYSDSEIDQDFFPSSTTPELQNAEIIAKQLSGITPAAGPAAIVVPAPPEPPKPSAQDEAADKPDQSANANIPSRNSQMAERSRIANSISDAQRAQASMFLATLGSSRAMEALNATSKEDDNQEIVPSSKDPFAAHPYALPEGASSAMIAKAMERALDRYSQTRQQSYQGLTSAAPRAVPLAVR